MTTALAPADRGSVLLIVVLATAVLAALCVTLLATATHETGAASSAASSDEALAAADALVSIARRHLAVDLERDRDGWSNRILAIGPRTLPEAWRAGATLDASGDVTGTPGTYWIDLGATACGDGRCASDEEWRRAMSSPAPVPALPWTIAEGELPRYLPASSRFRLRLLGFRESPGAADGVLRWDRIGVVAEGSAARSAGDGARRARRQVIAILRAIDAGPWGGALFASETVSVARGSTVRGSIHVLDAGGTRIALALSGGSRIENSLSGIDSRIALRLRIPDPHALRAEIRVRTGDVSLGPSDHAGGSCEDPAECAAAPDPPIASPGKGPLDAVLLGPRENPGRFVGAADNHVEDRRLPYDAPPVSLPELAAPFEDLHAHRFATYEAFLAGLPDGTGTHALSLDAVASSAPLAFDGSLAAAIRRARVEIVEANGADVPTPWADPSWGPGVTSDGPVDVLVDPAGESSIVGVFRHLPAREEASWSSCVISRGGGHGFLLLPALATTSPTLGPELVWDFVQRNFARYASGLSERDRDALASLVAFFGKAPDDPAPRLSPIPPANRARIIFLGAILARQGSIAIAGPDVLYLGRATIAATGDRASITISGSSILPSRRFPTDALGLLAAGRIDVASAAKRSSVMAALYAGEEIALGRVALAGAAASRRIALDAADVAQSLDLARALPPFMIGAAHPYVIRQESWQELETPTR
ncbi:MAG: hypothetical protein U0166_27205 [Acidobacteriota bacterium]